MQKLQLLLFSLGLLISQGTPIAAQPSALMGFSESTAKIQLQLEKDFDTELKSANLDTWLKRLSAHPHHVGSPYDKENAAFMASLFKSWGYDVAIEEYQVLFPTPKLRQLEMIAPNSFKAKLAEPPLKEDATSGQTDEQLPTYNCWSPDGEVTAELVFVNYGIPADYEELEKMGIDVKGKIVIAKYQGSWRGIKPKVAAEHGAIGCIIYSDPRDDGFFQGDVYPKGAFRGEQGVQRGSVLDMPILPGDPLTPGYASTKDAKRLDRKDITNMVKIPVLPISYGDALPLLSALSGRVAPESWRGALPITYHIGPGPAKVHLKLEFDWQIRPIYNVIAKMKGSEYPDQWVIRGNHHDGWVNGASDPLSSMVVELEEARTVATLAKTGWRPKRTLVYCAWDGEEPGLLGSTEWVEDHAVELREKAVLYINTDGVGRGFLGAGGSHTLERYFDQISRSVIDPETGISAYDRLKANDLVQGRPEPEILKLGALGSGSDFSPFLQHLGIASMDLGFGGEDGGGEYHSIYDTYDHYVRFADPEFKYGVALAKVAGRTMLRMANAEYLPFEFQQSAKTIGGYVEEVIKLADDMREKTNKENRLIREGLYKVAADPKKTFVVPAIKEEVPFFNFAPLQNAMESLKKNAAAYAFTLSKSAINPAKAEALNQQLKNIERALTRPEGLPGRSWYQHFVYAPGLYTGYGVKTLPGVREAIEQRAWGKVQGQINLMAKTLEGYALAVGKAREVIEE